MRRLPSRYARALSEQLKRAIEPVVLEMPQAQLIFRVVHLAVLDLGYSDHAPGARRFLESETCQWYLSLLGINTEFVERLLLQVARYMDKQEAA